MAMVESIVTVFLPLMLILIVVVVVVFAFKPWRFFFSSHFRPIEANDLERPLVLDDANVLQNQSNEFPSDNNLEDACFPTDCHFLSSQIHGLVDKQRVSAASPYVPQGDSLVVDIVSDAPEDVDVGQTLKLPPVQLAEIKNHSRLNFQNAALQDFVQRDIIDQRTAGICLTLEVITGPSRGLHHSVQLTDSSRLPLILGRVSPSDLLIKDSEVSGKHALINWNVDKMKWEVVDMGSLNGTLLNAHPINLPDTDNRRWGDPMELANGDIITLGTTSKVIVHITSQHSHHVPLPFGIGLASDPMALRRGAKKLPMEDVCYHQWPLPGLNQFGLFGICDGHGGDAAARSASKLLPEVVASILSDSLKRERVLSLRDASDVLRDAFSRTDACMNHHFYEGCTATVLLVWADGAENFFVQCANVGDSACIMNVNGTQIKMTDDHKISNNSERLRMEEMGKPLKDGETRLYGINLARMLGDKFLKQQDSRFSSEPYISPVIHIDQASKAFALLASDGLWDVISMKKAIQLVLEMREKDSTYGEKSAEKMANFLLSEARALRTKDNTSVIFLDFDTSARFSCKARS